MPEYFCSNCGATTRGASGANRCAALFCRVCGSGALQTTPPDPYRGIAPNPCGHHGVAAYDALEPALNRGITRCGACGEPLAAPPPGGILRFWLCIVGDDRIAFAPDCFPLMWSNLGRIYEALVERKGLAAGLQLWRAVGRALHTPGFIEMARHAPTFVVVPDPRDPDATAWCPVEPTLQRGPLAVAVPDPRFRRPS